MKRIIRTLRNNRGFTLIEAVVVMMILGALSVISFSMVADTAGIFRYVSDESQAYGELWVAMERMVREMETSDPATFNVAAGGLSVTFTNATKAACANCMDQNTAITYTLNGNTLQRTTAAGTFAMADNISIPSTAPAGQQFIFQQTGKIIRIQMERTVGEISIAMDTKVYPNPDLTEDIQ